MTDLSLTSITSEDVTKAKEILINVLKSSEQYKNLDLNAGTVLHDLLLRPSAEILAMAINQFNYLEETKSLQAMVDSGAAIPADAVNSILSNFGVTLYEGSKASGQVMIKVNADKEYTVAANSLFTDSSGLKFFTTDAVTANRRPGTGETTLYPASDGNFYFVVTVIAENEGTNYLLNQGTRLNMEYPMYNFVSAEAYNNFTGADPSDTIQEAIDKLPYSISTRTLDSRTSIRAILTDPDFGNFTSIQDMSVIGAGDAGQLRDKHNAFGVAMFGRVDIYPRTFITPAVTVLSKTGTRIAPNTYEFDISESDAPGFYSIFSITDAESVVAPTFNFNTLTAIGSYRFTEVRSAAGVNGSGHDISQLNELIETAYTIYQKSHVTVYDVMTGAGDTHEFKVELYAAPDIAGIQTYVDSFDVKSVKADILVRSPLMCISGLRMNVEASVSSAVTVDELKNKLADYINRKSFVSKITQAELVGVAYTSDIKTIDLSSDPTVGFKFEGEIRAADGEIKHLYGPNLIIDNIADHNKLVLPSTCIFCTDINHVFINLIKV